MELLSRIFVFLRFFSVLKEIKLYSEYLLIIKKQSITNVNWAKLKLRYDWFGRIYTVVNLPPEVVESRDFPVEARPAFVFEEVRPINEFLTSLNLQELLAPLLQPIPETNGDSFLVIYYYVFRELSWIWIFRFAFEIFASVWIFNNWDFLIQTINQWI
jgi:hypothetical protein